MVHILKYLHLKNFKCFQDHTIFFSDNTIVVGKNNAGKTTVVEALRILGLVASRFKTTSVFIQRPDWLSSLFTLSTKGIRVSTKAIDIELEQVFHRYGTPPAMIEAYFSDNILIKVYINSQNEFFAVFFQHGKALHSHAKVLEAGVPDVRVLPQITPLLKDEPLVGKDTLARNQFSRRTSGNFRNSLLSSKNKSEYSKLQELISQTWGAIKINRIEPSGDGKTVYLYLRDSDFVTEIYYMGHGIQMWIQTLWFIVSSEETAIIVLDEPDVYMHADLQRKLVRMLKSRYSQMIIATHSIEIVSEVQPENILIIDRKSNQSLLADGYPVLQTAISGLGSIHNISLSRILNNKRYIYLEGNDMEILKVFYDRLFPDTNDPLDHFPYTSTGGWGSWQIQKKHAQALLHDMPDLRIYFIYDRDYHSAEEITNREGDALSSNIRMHIWKRKEIENYVISASAIARYIAKKNRKITVSSISSEIGELVLNVLQAEKDYVIEKKLDEFYKQKKSKGIEASTALRIVRSEVEKDWIDIDQIIKLVSGKSVIAKLSDICKERFGVSFSAQQIASSMTRAEIDREVIEVLSRIKDGV